jgi:hypothetical protein
LSVDDPHVSIGNTDLPRVSPERDTLTDDDHKALDTKILEIFSANRKFNEEPKLPALLSIITIGDKRIKTLTPDEAEELLGHEPSIKTVLRNAWRKEVFKEVRQLGALIAIVRILVYSRISIVSMLHRHYLAEWFLCGS